MIGSHLQHRRSGMPIWWERWISKPCRTVGHLPMIDDVLHVFTQIKRTILTICGYIYILYCMWVLNIYIYIHALSCLLSWNPVDHLISMGLTNKNVGFSTQHEGSFGSNSAGLQVRMCTVLIRIYTASDRPGKKIYPSNLNLWPYHPNRCHLSAGPCSKAGPRVITTFLFFLIHTVGGESHACCIRIRY